MLNLEQLLNVHQTLQAGSATKSLYEGISLSVKAGAHTGFIDNARAISEIFSLESAERYLIKQGLSPELPESGTGKHAA